MSKSPIIALLTDFGNGSPYVAQMKGVIYGILPQANVVDVTHAIDAQDVHQAAWLLEDVRDAFPPGTIFVVVVDPGVGSGRSIIALRTSAATFIGPDNGVFSRISAAEPAADYFGIDNPKLWRDPVSATFHGRDIMAPVAAHLADGTPIHDVGARIANIETLDFPPPRPVGDSLVGRIEYADSFGNLITNIAATDLADKPTTGWIIQCAGRDAIPLVTCYANRSPGECVALIGSGGRLEVAIVSGNAEVALGARRHGEVVCLAPGKSRESNRAL